MGDEGRDVSLRAINATGAWLQRAEAMEWASHRFTAHHAGSGLLFRRCVGGPSPEFQCVYVAMRAGRGMRGRDSAQKT